MSTEPYELNNPRSLCTCGHTGDGLRSDHVDLDLFDLGLGRCRAPGCPCNRFCWHSYLKPYQKYLATKLRPHPAPPPHDPTEAPY